MTVYVNEAKKESILLHRLNSRMITIDHMYTPLLSEETIYSTHHHALARRKLKPGLDVIVNHAFALPRIRTIQRRQQSGAQSLVHSLPYPLLSGPRNYSHNCPGEERNTKQKKQKVPRLYNKLLPALAVPAKQNHTVQEVQALLEIWHAARSLAKCFKASPPCSGSCIALVTPRCCSLCSGAGWRNASAALGASPEALGMMAVAAGHCSQQGKSLTRIVKYSTIAFFYRDCGLKIISA
jgi:hypothetical protein